MGIFGIFNRRISSSGRISSSKYARLAVGALNSGRGLLSIDIEPFTKIVCDKCGAGSEEPLWFSGDGEKFILRCPNCNNVIVEQK